jgi:hypothetical protein
MITSEEAKQKVLSGDFIKESQYVKEIEKRILSAIGRGQLYCEGKDILNKCVVTYLQTLGYRYEEQILGYSKFHIIRWD